MKEIIDLDPDMIEGLRVKIFGLDNVDLILGDILETDIRQVTEKSMEEHGLSELRIIGNLPYYITTPIIMKLLEAGTGAKSITVMMQKEVGDRIAAEPIVWRTMTMIPKATSSFGASY